MASPTFTTDTGTEVDVCTVTLPTTIAANDLLLVAVRIASTENCTFTGATDSTSDAWTEFATSSERVAIYTKVAHGDEDSGSLTINRAAGNEGWGAIIMQIPAADWQSATAVEASASSGTVASTTTVTPQDINPSWDASENTFFGIIVSTTSTQTASPSPISSGYTLENWLATPETPEIGLAHKEDVVAGVEDPGNWTLDTSSAYETMTFAVRLTQAGGGSASAVMRRRR